MNKEKADVNELLEHKISAMFSKLTGSFDEKKEGAFQNLFKTPETRLEVDREAVNCVYNEDRRCKAEHIGITGDGAHEASHTECATFKMR